MFGVVIAAHRPRGDNVCTGPPPCAQSTAYIISAARIVTLVFSTTDDRFGSWAAQRAVFAFSPLLIQ
jgi:hypothetical protein